MCRFYLILILILVGFSASAQNFSEKKMKIDDVTVIGKRTIKDSGVTKTVIDSTALTESSHATFAELLSKHSSLFIKSYGLGSTATVSFRGTAASHTQVEWNGININNPMLGEVDFSMMPVWLIDKTELLHGGSSLQAGSGALGGSVIVGSTPTWGKKIYGSLMQSVGSFGNYQTFASIGGGGDKIQIKIRYIYGMAENDFEFFNNAVLPNKYQKQTNADYKKHGAVADIYYNMGKGHYLSVNGWFHTAKRNLPTIMSYQGKPRTEWQKDDEYRAVAKWIKYSEEIKSELTSGFSKTSLDYLLKTPTNLGEVTNNDSRSGVKSFQNRYKIEWNITNRTVLSGVLNLDYHRVNTLNHLTKEGYEAERFEAGASVSVHHRFSKLLSGFALARYDNSGSFMPSVGIELEPVTNLIFKINGTRNYHRPTLNDLYWLPGGNPDLRPERGYTADIAADYNYKQGNWDVQIGATGFVSWIDDWIMWQPSEYRYWTASNLKKVFSRGAELYVAATYNLQKWRFTLSGNYGYTRTTNEETKLEGDESKGKQLIYIPVNKANVMLDVKYRGFYLNYIWSYTGERFTSSDNETARYPLLAYDTHNISIGKVIKWFDIQLKIDNLFNENYQAILWRAMPRRNYNLLLKYTF